MENLLAKYFSGEASKGEQERVHTWRGASEENAKAFLEYKTIWLKSSAQDQPDQAFLKNLLQDEDQPIPQVVPLWKTPLFRYAASLFIVFGIGLVFYMISQKENQPTNSNYDIIGFKELSTQELPDGTTVVLQKGATLEVRSFDDIRSVKLIGKAYFDVARDESKPFVIEANNAVIEVLGTSFVVETSNETNDTEVLVESGKVGFSGSDKEQKVELIKGERGFLSSKGLATSMIEDRNYLSWKTREIEFRKSELKEVSRVLEDVYDVAITFENDQLESCKLTATFNNKNIAEVIDIMKLTFGIDAKVDNNKILISGTGCH